MAKTLSVATLIAASTSNASGATTRGILDCRTLDGGTVTVKVTNGASGPSAAAEIRFLIAHNTGASPAAGSAGSDWKTVYRVGCTTVNNDVTEFSWEFGPGIAHIEVEITGNLTNAVTCEAFATGFAY